MPTTGRDELPFSPGWVPFADALFRSLPGLAYVVDQSGRFVRWNTGYNRLFGIADEEMPQLAMLDLVVEGDRPRAIAVMREVFNGKEALFECTLSYNGAEVQVFGTGVLVHIEGAPHIVGTGIVISSELPHYRALRAGEAPTWFETAPSVLDYRRTVEQARMNERRLALALSATADGMWEWNVPSGEMYFSPRWYEMLGYDNEQLPPRIESVFELCHPEELHVVRTRLGELLEGATDSRYEAEFRMRRADGSWAWVLTRVAVTERDGQGRPLVCSGTNTDVTLRRQAEREIADWKLRYDRLLEASGRIVYERNLDGSILWGGPVGSLLGYRADELSGGVSQWADMIHAEDRDATVLDYASAQRDRRAFAREYRMLRKGGGYSVMRDAGYPEAGNAGDPVRYVGTLVDVTEERRATIERQQMEEMLRHSQKLESVGRLAGGVAHDFNNLLTVIDGNLQLALTDGSLSPRLQGFLNEATVAAESAAAVTRQLLTFSRKQVFQPSYVNLNTTVERIRRMLHRLIGENIVLAVSLNQDLGLVEVDDSQIEQVLVNLLVNSRDAMPSGGRITIVTDNTSVGLGLGARRGITPGQYVHIAVIDTGCGMTAEVKRHLFEPFFTTKAVGKGTGLGLAMTYGVVRASGGYVAVESEPGEGTRVNVFLPRKLQESPSPAPEEPDVSRGGGETIVVAEDEELVRNLLVRVLEWSGYKVLAFSSGEDALGLLSDVNNRADLLLTDVVMPGMNGRELAERARDLRPDLKVLYASGYTDDIIHQHGVAEQGAQFISKPYSISELTNRLRGILDAQAAAFSRD
jgi:two-component system, cell cycle sensor histidine kinase and response regulator CckA